MLIHYIRTPKKKRAVIDYKMDNRCGARIIETGGDPIGVIVAIDKNKVGWSLCSPRDKCNKERGKMIAQMRAEAYGTDLDKTFESAPYSIRLDIQKMYERSQKYFK